MATFSTIASPVSSRIGAPRAPSMPDILVETGFAKTRGDADVLLVVLSLTLVFASISILDASMASAMPL